MFKNNANPNKWELVESDLMGKQIKKIQSNILLISIVLTYLVVLIIFKPCHSQNNIKYNKSLEIMWTPIDPGGHRWFTCGDAHSKTEHLLYSSDMGGYLLRSTNRDETRKPIINPIPGIAYSIVDDPKEHKTRYKNQINDKLKSTITLSNDSIEKKAREIDTLLWKHCRSPENLLYTFVMKDALHRVTQEDIAAEAPDPDKLSEKDLMYSSEKMSVRWVNGKPQYLVQGIPLEDVEAYEDSQGTTGAYLSALCFQYQATMDPAILDRAHIVFEALYSIYELGLKEQKGWIPKPYGFLCTKQSSMDNQCQFYQGLVRYYKIAPSVDKDRIRSVLVDEMDYWIRNRYKMHVPYFGLWVDYASEKFYPGHWSLFFLPLCDVVWKITGEKKYEKEYAWLLSRTNLDPDKDPEYLLTKVRCLHRWYYEFGALLEQGAEPRELWLQGLKYQILAFKFSESRKIDTNYIRFDISARHHEYTWLVPRSEENRLDIANQLLEYKLEDSLYRFPGYGKIKPLAFRSKAIATGNLVKWLETFWIGRVRGDW